MKKDTLTVTAIAVAILFVTITGCKRENSDAPGSLYLHLQTTINNNAVLNGDGTLYPDANGRLMGLTAAQFYISDIGIQNANGTWYNLPNTYILARIQQQNYLAGNVPPGNYTGIRFNVGLDSTTNATTPEAYSATGPDSVLSNNELWMYYGWQWMGYIFMNLQGKVDISPAHDGSQVVPLAYEIGSNANLKNVTMSIPFTVSANRSQSLNIICDYGKLLQSVNLADSIYRGTDTYLFNPSTSTTVSGFIPGMFRYQNN